jgi:hypothetical protein
MENIYFSTYPPPTWIHLSCLFTQSVETRSIQFYRLLSQPISHVSFIIFNFRMSLREFLDPAAGSSTEQALPTVSRKHLFMNILCPQRAQENAAFRYYTPQAQSPFDYWNQPLNMRMQICYLDCHEGGLCSFLMIHIEDLLLPLQLLYFHLWPIYWLSLPVWRKLSIYATLGKSNSKFSSVDA